MLFMNIARKFGAVYQEEAGTETGSPAATAPSEPAAPATPESPATPTTPAAPAVSAPGAVDYSGVISEYAEGKPALAVALGFLGECGIDHTGQAFELAKGGDFTLLEAELAKLGKAGTAEMVAILKQEVEANDKAAQEHAAKTEQTLEAILGESKDVILEWARNGATEQEKSAINEMLDAGGFYAHCAAVALREAYQNSNTTIPAKNPVTSSSASQGAATALTARDFAAECEKLSRANGGADPRLLPGYAQLQQRRAVGRKQGI